MCTYNSLMALTKNDWGQWILRCTQQSMHRKPLKMKMSTYVEWQHTLIYFWYSTSRFKVEVIYIHSSVACIFTVYQVIYAERKKGGHIKCRSLSWADERVNLFWRVPSRSCSLLPSLSYSPAWRSLVPAHMPQNRCLPDWRANLKCQLFLCKWRYSFFLFSSLNGFREAQMGVRTCVHACMGRWPPPPPKQKKKNIQSRPPTQLLFLHLHLLGKGADVQRQLA